VLEAGEIDWDGLSEEGIWRLRNLGGVGESIGETPPQAEDSKHAQDAKGQDDPSKDIVVSD
jgi:hypothetical protein